MAGSILREGGRHAPRGAACAQQETACRSSSRRRREARTGEPRKIGDILAPALTRLDGDDRARAYGVWARAAGDTVAAHARPRSLARGVLTVECASSIWAQELTYLGPQLLARMSELDPGHPVERFRFVTCRSPVSPDGARAQDEARPPSKRHGRGACISITGLEAAKEAAKTVADERLRKAIEAALVAASGQPSPDPLDGPPVNREK